MGEGFAFFCWSRTRFHRWDDPPAGVVRVMHRLWVTGKRSQGVW